MSRYIMLIASGTKFNKLTILYQVRHPTHADAHWMCQCDCGKETRASGTSLRSGRKKTCSTSCCTKGGLTQRELTKRWKLNNPDKVRAWKSKYRSKPLTREKERFARRAWVAKNADHVREHRRNYRQQNKARCNELKKAWAAKNAVRLRAFYKHRYERILSDPVKSAQLKKRNQINYQKNRDSKILAQRRHYQENRDAILLRNKTIHRKRINAWYAERRKTNPNYRLRCNLGMRISKALKGVNRAARTIDLLGCSIESFWLYLESKFEEGMTRENYGKVWEVDHVLPCAIFDLTKKDHQRRCFHYSNLQPLFERDNKSKGAKVPEGVTVWD